jgi:allantoate deiminase
MVSASGARAVARCDTLGVAPFSATPNGLFRAFLTPAHAAALKQTAAWMREAGMNVRLDAAANLIGRYEASRPDAKALLIGSHIDSVRDAGKYDGPLGVMLGIECAAALHESGRRLPFAIEVIAFGDEEGSRFPASMLCSRAAAGALDPAALDAADAQGVSVRDARASFGAMLDIPSPGTDFISAAYKPSDVLAFLEAHIEQGPVLEADRLALGVVSGIAAQLRFQVRVSGIAGHAGTNAMRLRKDALAGAAEMVLAIETIARKSDGVVVATVGVMSVKPGAVNVVPGDVEFSIDIRSGDQKARNAAAADVVVTLERIADVRGLKLSCRQVQDLPASPCDAALNELLKDALRAAGHEPRVLVSGAGHDTMSMARLCPTAMLFIRCAGGISHNPAEAVTDADADAALAVMLGFIERLEKQNG